MATIYQLPKIIGKDKKPSLGARINWHHPLSQGLVGAWLFNEDGGLSAWNLASNTKGSATSGLSWDGGNINFAGTAEIDTTELAPFNWEDTQPITIVFRLNTTGETNYFQNFQTRGWCVRSVTAGYIDLLYCDNSSYLVARSDTGVSYNVWTDIGILYNGNTHPSGVTFYKDGIKIGTNSAVDGLTGSCIAPISLRFAKGNYSVPFKLGYVYIWTKLLSEGEIISFHANPYQMFLPVVWDVYFVPAAAPPPTGGKSIFGYDNIFHAGGIIQT